MDDIDDKYSAFYRARTADYVYPVEFVVRAFLGTYPRLKTDRGKFAGQRILDLGFGDGRNMPLLSNLGFDVHGLEITEDICKSAIERIGKLGYEIKVRAGRNNAIPYAAEYFDHVLACHACYYVDPGSTFSDNVAEIARIMKTDGLFVFSAPIGSSYIMKGARDIGDKHMEITNDPYGVRNGYVLKSFDDATEIELALMPYFGDCRIGSCRNDWWGIDEHVWTVVCRRM